MEDESARLPKAIGGDGVWKIAVPDSLNGHPVVAIGDYGLVEGVWGDVILPESLTYIDEGAFYGCTGADAITVPPSVTWIGESAFEACAATLRVTEGSYAAGYAQEKNIPYTYDMGYTVCQSDGWLYTLTDGVATIYGYENDEENDDEGDEDNGIDLVFPSQLGGYPVAPVNRLPLRRFQAYNALASVTIPASVTEITGYPFVISFTPYVNDIARIFVSPDNPVYEDIDGVLFDKQTKTLLVCPSGRTGSHTIPDGVTAIGGNSFQDCYRLTSVTIPGSVTHIGDYAFYVCSSLTSVTIPGSVTHIGDYAFHSCFGLTNVTIPQGVTSIGNESFTWCHGLTSVTIPASVTSIGRDAFFTAPVTLSVVEGSYAEQYAKENEISLCMYRGQGGRMNSSANFV